MGARIECYVDIASLYGHLAFLELQRNRETLSSHGVEVEYHPVLLGGIMSASGNKPPMALPAKSKHGVYDSRRSIERCGNPVVQFPPDFLKRAVTVLPLRVLHAVKSRYPRETFETVLHYFFYRFWSPPHPDLTDPSALAEVLGEVPSHFGGGSSPHGESLLFSSQDVENIMKAAASPEIKDRLRTSTQEALDRGAFGAPWFWVTNRAGRAEPFFGSDRFHFIYKFLDLPFQDIALLPPGGNSGSVGAKL